MYSLNDHIVVESEIISIASHNYTQRLYVGCLFIPNLNVFSLSTLQSCLKNTLKDRKNTTKKETLLDAKLKPLDKKDLMLIYTLGPKTSTMKHVCV